MAGVILPDVQGLSSVDDLKNAVAKMTKELSWLLNNLDTRNMNYIDGDIVVEGSITAAKLFVEELSAISANLGHITAGLIEAVQIFGSYIATSQSFPRSEMSNSNNMFASRASASNAVEMRSTGSNSVSDLRFVNGSNLASISHPSATTGLYINNGSGNLTMEFMNIFLRGYSSVKVLDWSRLRNEQTNNSLADELSNLAINMTFDPTTRNLKLWSKGGSLLAQVNIP